MKSLFVVFLFMLFITTSYSVTDESIIRNNVGWVEKLGDKIDFDANVINLNNETKRLGDFIDPNKPTVFVLSYYSCPKMCTFLLDGTLEVVNSNDKIRPGRDYNLITLSFDTKDNYITSSAKETRYNKKLNSKDEEWTFYSADTKNIELITNSVGFKFVPDGDEFAHPAGIIFLTKEGKISRYLSGVLFDPKDFKLALLEASDGVIGESTLKDKVLLYCYGFDPVGKKYAIKALNVVKLSGGITLVLVVIFMFFMWIKKDKKNKEGRN